MLCGILRKPWSPDGPQLVKDCQNEDTRREQHVFVQGQMTYSKFNLFWLSVIQSDRIVE